MFIKRKVDLNASQQNQKEDSKVLLLSPLDSDAVKIYISKHDISWIAAFPGLGKTTLQRKASERDFDVYDTDDFHSSKPYSPRQIARALHVGLRYLHSGEAQAVVSNLGTPDDFLNYYIHLLPINERHDAMTLLLELYARALNVVRFLPTEKRLSHIKQLRKDKPYFSENADFWYQEIKERWSDAATIFLPSQHLSDFVEM